MGFIFGLLLVLGGGVVMYYNKQLERMLGPSDRANRTLGGTDTMYVMIGFGLVILGVLMRFGLSPSNPTAIQGDFVE